ncbi:MAG: hypothetical protein HRT57_13220 [Crocinitomicaceae bacterium]|nr:hypothetical protein [Crocinitomicaceae bacterium]
MKNNFLLFACLLFQSIAWSQSDTLNNIDKNGKRQGYWIIYGKDQPKVGIPDDQIYKEGFYIDDRKEGLWKIYYKDGIHVRLKGNYKDNKPAGEYKKYWQTGTLKEEGTYHNKVYINSRKKYYLNGVINSHEYYDSVGKIRDTAYFYLENGCYQRIKIYQKSINQLQTKFYYPDSCNVLRKETTSPF